MFKYVKSLSKIIRTRSTGSTRSKSL